MATERIDLTKMSAFDRHPCHDAETRSVIVSDGRSGMAEEKFAIIAGFVRKLGKAAFPGVALAPVSCPQRRPRCARTDPGTCQDQRDRRSAKIVFLLKPREQTISRSTKCVTRLQNVLSNPPRDAYRNRIFQIALTW